MNKTRNNKTKKNKSNKSTNGGTDLNQKYSLASIDEGNELGGFKHSNTIIGFLGIGTLLYYTFFKQNMN